LILQVNPIPVLILEIQSEIDMSNVEFHLQEGSEGGKIGGRGDDDRSYVSFMTDLSRGAERRGSTSDPAVTRGGTFLTLTLTLCISIQTPDSPLSTAESFPPGLFTPTTIGLIANGLKVDGLRGTVGFPFVVSLPT
jgi:hypothetical protein